MSKRGLVVPEAGQITSGEAAYALVPKLAQVCGRAGLHEISDRCPIPISTELCSRSTPFGADYHDPMRTKLRPATRQKEMP